MGRGNQLLPLWDPSLLEWFCSVFWDQEFILTYFCEQQIRSLSWWPTSWPIWTTPLLGGAAVKKMHVRKLWILNPHIPTLGAPISMMKHGCRTPPLPTFGAGGPTIPLQIPSSRRRRAFLGGCPAAAPPNIAAKGSGRRAKRMNFSAKLSSSKVWSMKPEHSQYHVPNLPFFCCRCDLHSTASLSPPERSHGAL